MPASAVVASQAASTPPASATPSVTGFQSTIDYAALKQSANDNPSSVANKDALPSKQVSIKPDELLVFKTQALLNWHGHSVGALTGIMNKNTIKAMQIFQQKHNLPVTTTMNEATWSALTSNETLNKQPIFINYQLTRDDLVITKVPRDMQYKSAREAVAEKFHMSQKLVSRLNPTTPLKAGNIISGIGNLWQGLFQSLLHQACANKLLTDIGF
jgi:peptidoglycan hydrolase-like protein with peptidoglycan-binding domain